MPPTRDQSIMSQRADERGTGRFGGTDGDQRPLRVLHVDDDDAYRETLADAFDRWGEARVVSVATTAAATDRLDRERFDCIVLDQALPERDGLALLRDGTVDETPVVLLTGYGDEALAGEAIHAGVSDYYAKHSDDIRDLVTTVETYAEQDRQRRELERTRRRYELVASLVTEAVFEWDLAAGELSLEEEPLFGYEGRRFDVEWVRERIHPDDLARVRETLANGSRERARRTEVEFRFRRADGEYADVRATVRFPDAGVRRAIGAVTDVTERRSHLRELERQNERLDRFASVVSHDLRNPLAVAEGYLQLARETGDGEHFDRAADALDRIEELVDDLLELARSGQGVDDVGPVLLSGVVTEAWENVAAGNARLRVVDDATVRADRNRLCQLAENLFRNALEHGRADERTDMVVSVGTLADGDGFYVEDDGTGIPEDVGDRAFETGVTSADEGTGFGLAIVEEIVAGHDWTVTATEAETGGARFEITGVTTE